MSLFVRFVFQNTQNINKIQKKNVTQQSIETPKARKKHKKIRKNTKIQKKNNT